MIRCGCCALGAAPGDAGRRPARGVRPDRRRHRVPSAPAAARLGFVEFFKDLDLSFSCQRLQHIGGERIRQQDQQFGRVEIGQCLDELGDLGGLHAGDTVLVRLSSTGSLGITTQKLDRFPVVHAATRTGADPAATEATH